MRSLRTNIILLIGVGIVSLVSVLFKYRKVSKVNKEVRRLKEKGNKIVISLKDCEIKTREYYDREPSDDLPSKAVMFDALHNPNQSYDGIKKIVSVLIYRRKDRYGKTTDFNSELIEMPVETLRFRLEKKQQTAIFVDRDNPNRYCFDMEFLY